ncbi:MAG: tripartite tricarboxylate transporter substrate binding protein [Thermodesulfobacteriota bacterium]
MKRATVVLVSVLLLWLSGAASTRAQEVYPNKPVQIVVPFAAGGSLDLSTRLLADKLKDILGQPVLTINKPGGGQALGAGFVATSKPDGYTLYASSGATFGFQHALNPSVTHRLQDFAPIAAIGSFPSVVVIRQEVPAKSLPELIAYIQQNPGKLTFGSTGFGGLNHLEFEMLRLLVKEKMNLMLDIQHVPYQGVAPALTALLGNQVQYCNLPFSSLVRKHDGASLRIVAVCSPKRSPFLPETATAGEQGFPELDGNNYYLNYDAPAKTPAPVLAKLESAFEKATGNKELQDKIRQMDTLPHFMNARDLQKWLEGQVARWEQVIKKANIVTK